MKKIIATILVFLCVISAFAQKDKLKTKLIDTAFIWGNASRAQIDSFYFQLLPLKYTNYELHIRIFLPERGQVMDLFGSDNKGYQGSLINYVQQYRKIKDKKNKYHRHEAFRYIYENVKLDSAAATEVAAYIEQSGLMNTHVDDTLYDGKIILTDCSSVIFEYCFNGNYFEQEYKCPWSQCVVIEKYRDIFLSNYDFLKAKLSLDILSSTFENKLSSGITYSRGGGVMFYKMTKKQVKQWQNGQPRRDYLKSIKDTVDDHLKQKLNEQDAKMKIVGCTEDYYVAFGKNGKFQKVRILKSDKLKLRDSYGISDYFDEKREIRKCKRKVRTIFKSINLNFLDLQYEVWRVFRSGYEGNYILRDPMTH